MRSIRWPIAILITVAVAIGYLDRQTLALTTKAIQQDIPISDSDFGNLQSLFYFAYALMYVGGGRLMDLLGTRRGFLLIVVWWSLACAGHGLAGGLLMLGAARLMLGLAQGGVFPGGGQGRGRVVSGPRTGHRHGHGQRRQLGRRGHCPAAVALVLCYAPLAMGLLSERRHRAALDRLVAVGLLPAGPAPATLRRRTPRDRRSAGLRRAAQSRASPGGGCCGCRQVWGMVLGKACCDAVWFTYIAWLPQVPWSTCAASTTRSMGSIAWIPYAASGVGSVVGGWWSSRLLHQRILAGLLAQGRAGRLRGRDALHVPGHARAGGLGNRPVQPGLLRPPLVFHAGHHLARRHVPAGHGRLGGGTGRLRRLDGRNALQQVCRLPAPAASAAQRAIPLLFAIGSTFHILGFLWILYDHPQHSADRLHARNPPARNLPPSGNDTSRNDHDSQTTHAGRAPRPAGGSHPLGPALGLVVSGQSPRGHVAPALRRGFADRDAGRSGLRLATR